VRLPRLFAAMFLIVGTSLLYPSLSEATCVTTAQSVAAASTAATVLNTQNPVPGSDTATATAVLVQDTCGGDDVSYQVALPTAINFQGTEYTAVYATTNSTIVFGQQDNNYSNFPNTPSISVNAYDWVVLDPNNASTNGYPAGWKAADEHLIITSSQAGFQVDLAVRPYGSNAAGTPLSTIVVTAAINADNTLTITYLSDVQAGLNTRTGVRLPDGTIVTLEQAGLTRVLVAPVVTAEAVQPAPTPTPSPLPSVEPTPTPSPTSSPVPSPTPTVEPTPSPSPIPTQTPTPTPSPSNTPVIPAPSPTPSPVDTSTPVPVQPTPLPIPTPSPTPSVDTSTATIQPTLPVVPEPTPVPTPVPIPVQPPAVEPQPVPIPVPVPVVEPPLPPAPEPIPVPVEEPVPVPVEEPAPIPVEEPPSVTPDPVDVAPVPPVDAPEESAQPPVEEPAPPVPPIDEPVIAPPPVEELPTEPAPVEPKPAEPPLPPVVAGLVPNSPDQLPETTPKQAPPEVLVPHVQVDIAGVENGGITFFGTKSQPQVVQEDGTLTPPPPPPGSGLPIPVDAITIVDTFIGQPGGVTFNAPDVAVPTELVPIEVPAALDAIPGAGAAIQAVNQAYVALANIGNDMSPITRKKAKKILVITTVISQAAAFRRKP
jgi:archaellin